MFNKKHYSVYKIFAVILVALSLSWLLMLSSVLTAKAKEEKVEPYGVYTNINLDISGNNGEIFATAKNKFTLGNSTIIVDLFLYSSTTYSEDYNQMKLESYRNTPDLDQGKTLEVRASTNGEQKYWRAVMRYKFDSRDWVERQTRTVLFNGYGQVLN